LQLEKQRLKTLNDNLEDLAAERTEDLQRANEQLAQVNSTMSELVSIVSHELRTPLTAIKSFAEILRDESDNLEREEQDNFLNIIDKESDRLTRLISDLLDLQKMQDGMEIGSIGHYQNRSRNSGSIFTSLCQQGFGTESPQQHEQRQSPW
jgi:signal transduction histidine kinase